MLPQDLLDLITFLEETPDVIRHLGRDLADGSLRLKPSAKEFSMLEHICHLRDIEQEGYVVRIRKLLTESRPSLPDIDGERLAAERDYNSQNFGEALQGFVDARGANIHTIKSLSPDQLTRSGAFENVGPVTLEKLLLMMREHDEDHRNALRHLRVQVLSHRT